MINEHKIIKITKRLNNAVNEELEKKGSDIRFVTNAGILCTRSDETYVKILRVDRKYSISFQLYYYMNFTDELNDEISTIHFLTEKYESLLNPGVK